MKKIFSNTSKTKEYIDSLIADMNEEPAVDVQEVKHGTWVPHEVMIRSPEAKNYDCSECGTATNRCTPYCPYCGSNNKGE